VGFVSVGFNVTRESGKVVSVLALPPFLGGDIAGDYDIPRTVGGPFAELVLELDDVIVEVGTRVDFSNSTDVEVSPRFGIAYRIGSDTRIRASVGRAFKLPSFFALASPAALGGNPDLRPETSWGADLGLQHEWREAGVNLGVTAFYNHFSDLIDFNFETFQNINRDAVETRGAELSLGWRVDDRFNIDFTVTHQEVEDLSSPEPLLQRPEWLSSLRATWQAHDRVLLALDVQQVSGSFDRQLPVPDRDRVAGRTLVGMTGSWDVAPQVAVVARADNLANATYETLIGFPGPSRSIRVGLRYAGR
jgi:outer membrane receptor protein involved in Fe transport